MVQKRVPGQRRVRFGVRLALVALALSSSCSDQPASPDSSTSTQARQNSLRRSEVNRGAPESRSPKVIFLGDSLTAGYQIAEAEAFPAHVGRIFEADGTPITVINAGISGDTTRKALNRLDWLLGQDPAVVVIGLGANDAFRGEPVEQIAARLRKLVERSQASGARVLLLGMRLPPNYGADYAAAFDRLYGQVAEETGAALVPFLLEGVAGIPSLNLPEDGLHPNPAGHARIAQPVAEQLAPLVQTSP